MLQNFTVFDSILQHLTLACPKKGTQFEKIETEIRPTADRARRRPIDMQLAIICTRAVRKFLNSFVIECQ